MKNLIKFGFTLAAGLVISACGSSGGGDNNSATTPTNTNSATTTTTPPAAQTNTNTTTTPTTTVTSNGTGGAVIIDDNGVKIAQINDSNLYVLNIEGKQVTIGYPGIYSGGWSETSTNAGSVAVCCGKYSNVRFGINLSENETQTDYFFYNGSPTTAMPSSGTATYQGEAIINGGENYSALDVEKDYVTGTSQFNVDFGAKTLTGNLNFNNLQAVNINANIAGNSFNGSANSASLKGTATVEGKFYGTNAKELGGIFSTKSLNDNAWGGAFGGAKK